MIWVAVKVGVFDFPQKLPHLWNGSSDLPSFRYGKKNWILFQAEVISQRIVASNGDCSTDTVTILCAKIRKCINIPVLHTYHLSQSLTVILQVLGTLVSAPQLATICTLELSCSRWTPWELTKNCSYWHWTRHWYISFTKMASYIPLVLWFHCPLFYPCCSNKKY